MTGTEAAPAIQIVRFPCARCDRIQRERDYVDGILAALLAAGSAVPTHPQKEHKNGDS